jgi:hypothetical protein
MRTPKNQLPKNLRYITFFMDENLRVFSARASP